MTRLLLVDDEENVLRALRRSLASEPYAIEVFTSPQDALLRAGAVDVDLVVADYRMPRMDGIVFLSALKDIRPDAMRLILSGYADLEALIDAINLAEIYRFISKPWQDYDLKTTLAQALAHRAVLLENQRLADQVRAQEAILNRQRLELERLEAQHPGITQVNWGRDGSVLLDENDV